MNNDLISRNELKEDLIKFFPTDCLDGIESKTLFNQILTDIDNAPTVFDCRNCKNNGNERECVDCHDYSNYVHYENRPLENPLITECRETAIEKNLPLYFVYYEETGILEVYITETEELFEKRHCYKHLSSNEFKELVTHYLDDYLDWRGSAE